MGQSQHPAKSARTFRARVRSIFTRDEVLKARKLGVTVGERCRFIGTSTSTFGSEPYLVTVGDHVTITSGVRFVTHDGGVWVLRDDHPTIDVFGPISIGDNVFIGMNTILMPGVSIGSNVVIGAGSLVTRDIPSDSVAAGSPARVLNNIQSYKEKSLAKDLGTKGMDASSKKRLLSEHFGMA